jgi:hypothetical protein
MIAVQLLHVTRIARAKGKKKDEVDEINIVLDPSRRVLFTSHTNKEKARNIAYSVGDIVKVTVIEHLFLEASVTTQ